MRFDRLGWVFVIMKVLLLRGKSVNLIICLWFSWLLSIANDYLQGQIKQTVLLDDEGLRAELTALSTWQAGETVSEAAVATYGLARCFAAEAINDSIFSCMQGCSYKEGCPVSRDSLRYLRVLHRDAMGMIRMGELVCHVAISADLLQIFRALYDVAYPIERMRLIDLYEGDDERSMAANNTSAFNFRRVVGSQQLSSHSLGLAVDVNPLYNPYVRRKKDGSLTVSPQAGMPYADRSATFPYKIEWDDLCYRLFRQHGFQWGGSWRRVKDYQHFEKIR